MHLFLFVVLIYTKKNIFIVVGLCAAYKVRRRLTRQYYKYKMHLWMFNHAKWTRHDKYLLLQHQILINKSLNVIQSERNCDILWMFFIIIPSDSWHRWNHTYVMAGKNGRGKSSWKLVKISKKEWALINHGIC